MGNQEEEGEAYVVCYYCYNGWDEGKNCWCEKCNGTTELPIDTSW